MIGMSEMLLAGLGLGALAGYVLLLVQSLRHQRQIDALQNQLDMFAASSINVARSVDTLVRNGDQIKQARTSSRRWLIQQAQQRIARGESLRLVADTLGLSGDEVRLLQVTSA